MESRHRLVVCIAGLECAGSDTAIVERALRAAPGVLSAYVNPITETAYLDYKGSLADAQVLRQVIADAGYIAGDVREM